MTQAPPLVDATELLRQMRAGERSSLDIVREHLERIEREQPYLNAATEVFRDRALTEARNPIPGPLSGLPVTVKETFAIEGCQVTMGSRRMRPIACSEDSAVIKKLRAAGAIIMARSNVPEFVMTGETDNLLYGRTNHPADPKRTCGGSSGGEGALVGSGCSPLGLGTDILGSIRIPACFCGVVGFRPHSGAVDKAGAGPVCGEYFETWNGIGPLARSVRDVRLAYDVIAHQRLPAPADVAGVRLLVASGFRLKYRTACIENAYTDGIEQLLAAGLTLERHDFSDVRRLFLNIPRLVTGEMMELWTAWLSSSSNKFRPAAELLRQAIGRPTVYPGLFMWFLISPLLRPRRSGTLARIVQSYEAARRKYHELLGEDGILILPTLGLLAPKHGGMNRVSLRPGVNGLFTAETFANYINLSAITLPAHRHCDPVTGLKPGIMLACAPGAEAKLLDVAALLEHVI
ncbi:MAG: amidase [Gammaproteobacteria bacterium]|nr:amidase [Gammaproteobacteria bacterium]